MSVCSTAVGLLATVAIVHIVITIIFGVLVGLVFYIDRKTKALRRRKQDEKTTQAFVAAGRTLSLSPAEQIEPEEVGVLHLGSTGKIVSQEKTITEDYDIGEENIKNPWVDNGDNNVSIEIQQESLDKPVPLRRRASPMVRTGSPLVRTGSPLVRTGSPLVRTGSPMIRTDSGGDVGKKARMSIISIASNISSKFRRSVDLSEEEAKLVVSMSSTAVIDDVDDYNINDEEGVLALSVDYKLDESTAEDDIIINHDQRKAANNGSGMEVKINLPWEASESSC